MIRANKVQSTLWILKKQIFLQTKTLQLLLWETYADIIVLFIVNIRENQHFFTLTETIQF